jgi:phospholipid transport system substrate-binding protein
MLTRRAAMTMIGATSLLATPPWSVRRAWAQATEQAVAFVKSTSDRPVAVVKSASSPADRRRRLQEIVAATVDVDDIARFCLIRFWRIATSDLQTEYIALFHDLLVTEIGSHLGEYQGVRVTMGLSRASTDTEFVITMVDRPNNLTTQVDWIVSTASASPKIVDLLAGGTSMRLTQSAESTAYLARRQDNIHEFIAGMRQQIAQNKQPRESLAASHSTNLQKPRRRSFTPYRAPVIVLVMTANITVPVVATAVGPPTQAGTASRIPTRAIIIPGFMIASKCS